MKLWKCGHNCSEVPRWKQQHDLLSCCVERLLKKVFWWFFPNFLCSLYTAFLLNLPQQVTPFSEICFFSLDLHSFTPSFSRPEWELAEAVQFTFFGAQLNCLLFLSILVEGFLWLYSLPSFLSTSGHLRKSSLPRKLSCAINDLQFEVDLSFNTIGLLIWTVIFGQFHFGEFQGFLDC